MSEYDEKKDQVRRLSSRAMQLKMDLHDLSEELPLNWELVPGIAQKTHDAFKELEGARAELKALKEAQDRT